jgi:hypothetical protein
MNRTTLARRYAPLVALAAIQLLIIATVPSKAPQTKLATGATGSAFNQGAADGVAGAYGTAGGPGGAGTAGAGGGATGYSGSAGSGTSVTAAGVGGGAGGRGGAGGGASAAASSDTHHCVSGREFDPNIAWYAPPCMPGLPGSAYPNNGGSTSMGVSPDTITILDYNGDAGAEVDQILKAEGLYESYQAAQVMDAAMQNYINKEFVLFGRHVVIKTYQGTCQTVPPDTNCLIPEMDKIAAQYKPYAVYWNTTLCSACFAELASKGVVTFGGAGFSDAFSNANAPYFYSAGESSTRIEEAFAEFYCKQLAKGPVQFAETGNALQNFDGKPRVLGIISTNDPDNENTVKQVLVPALQRGCGVTVTHFYFYAQDINTAAQQVAAGTAAMDTPQNPASIILCLCDPVAPAFLFEGEKSNNYYPENVIASDQGMDIDKAAQSYESGLGCPGGGSCEFDNAFGLSTVGAQQPAANNEGTRIYALGEGTNMPVDPTIAGVIAHEFTMMASLIENTGPALTPANMAVRAPALGAIGGGTSGHSLLQFQTNDYQWTQDARVVFWDKNQPSPYNNAPGTYIQIEGTRYNLGQFPVIPNGEPPIPATRQ